MLNIKPTWLRLAEAEIGVKETPGKSNTQRILEYHAATSLKASQDEVPWCSSFINFVMMQAKYKGTRSAAARSWLDWGTKLTEPAYGCVVVLSRGDSNMAGHVGLWLGDDGDKVQVLGGNQGNKVGVAQFPKSMVLGYRWI